VERCRASSSPIPLSLLLRRRSDLPARGGEGEECPPTTHDLGADSLPVLNPAHCFSSLMREGRLFASGVGGTSRECSAGNPRPLTARPSLRDEEYGAEGVTEAGWRGLLGQKNVFLTRRRSRRIRLPRTPLLPDFLARGPARGELAWHAEDSPENFKEDGIESGPAEENLAAARLMAGDENGRASRAARNGT